MQKITVCKDCPDRYPACHDQCEKFKEAKEAYQAYKDFIANAKSKDAVYLDYKRKKIRKERKA